MRTGQYAYYEQQVMQGANAVGNVGGSYACPGSGGHRQGAIGYWNYLDGDRTESWTAREAALGATVALDGSPEQAYLTDKLLTNLAVLEANHDIPCDIPGTGVQVPYYGTANNTAYGFGTISRNFIPFLPVINGSAFGGSGGYSCTGGPCSWANANFMNAYSSVSWVGSTTWASAPTRTASASFCNTPRTGSSTSPVIRPVLVCIFLATTYIRPTLVLRARPRV
jgi:hypothetical protein